MNVQTVAQHALERANEAHIKIEAHEDLCAERYAHIQTLIGGVDKTVEKVLSILAWGGSGLVVLLLTVLGFLAVRAMATNDDELQRLRNQVQIMQQHQAPEVSLKS